MPVPKKRHSNTRTRKRRANWKLFPISIGKCPQCGSPVLPHNACKTCGTYQGRIVLKIEEKPAKGEKEAAQAKEQPKSEKETKKEEEQKKEKPKGKKEKGEK